jgi:peptidoglycan/xylan/chitin deacetylase (PgdA/CDA1 family)
MDVSCETLLMGNRRLLTKFDSGDRTNTVAALSMIIPNLQARGFRFVALRQLVEHA